VKRKREGLTVVIVQLYTVIHCLLWHLVAEGISLRLRFHRMKVPTETMKEKHSKINN